MQERSMIDTIKSRDVRHFLFSWLDTNSVGKLTQVSQNFKVFGNERMVWSERLRRVFNITTLPDQDPKALYLRLKSEYAELTAYLKQFCIYKLYTSDVAFEKATGALNIAICNHTWQPLNNEELLQLALQHGGNRSEFESLSNVIDHMTAEKTFFASPSLKILIDEKDPAQFKWLGNCISLAYASRYLGLKSYVAALDETEETQQKMLNLCLTGIVLILAPVFLTRRGYTEALISFLDRIDKNHFPDIDSEIQEPRIRIDYGDELFKKALGHLCLATTPVMGQEPIKPSAQIVSHLIARNATCIKAKDTPSSMMRVFDSHIHGYTSINHNPLWMVIESINVVNEFICKTDESAQEYLRELNQIAFMLLDNGEDINKIFMPNINPARSLTPAAKIHEMLKMIERDEKKEKRISNIDSERKRVLESILTYQPKLKPAESEYVDTFPYFKP